MGRYLIIFLLSVTITTAYSQVEKVVIDKVATSSLGTTFHVYAELKNEGDKVLAVYGDSANVLMIHSSKPFYQNRFGGGLSTNIRKNMLEVRDSLKYDSWLTIGSTNNYNNNLKTLGLSVTKFEENGGDIVCKDGAWYCLPIDKQGVADETKRVLLMQLTTHGDINGTISIMGKTFAGVNFQVPAISFKSN